jgi:hypothetical protein
MNKIKIAYCGHDVISAEHEVENVEQFADFLNNKVSSLDDAKKYVTAFADNKVEEWVDGYGDEMFWAPRSNPRKKCPHSHLFLHMKGKWHVTDDGCDWEPVTEFFKVAA